ncbi:MAG: sulfotransferase [Gammaproteobacteria bacterium]
MRHWPNVFVVGAPKSGTTSLYHYLGDVPDVFMPPVKEPHYFSPVAAPLSQIQRIDSQHEYLRLFRGVRDEKLIADVSPACLRDPESAKLIKQSVPDARIIISLRDPVERAYSHFCMAWGRGNLTESFEALLEALPAATLDQGPDIFYNSVIWPGFYATQVQRYLDVFGQDRVKIIIFDDLIRDSVGTVEQILKFLGVANTGPTVCEEIYNPYYEPRSPLALEIIRNKAVRFLGKHLFPRTVSTRIIRQVLGKKAAKPPMSTHSRLRLTAIYQNDVNELRKILNLPALWNTT